MVKYEGINGMSKDFEELMNDTELKDRVETAKDFFNEIDNNFAFDGVDETVQEDVENYLDAFNQELSVIQNTYQEQVNAYKNEFDLEKQQLDEYLYKEYGEMGVQMAAEIDNPYEINQAELEKIRQQIEKENQEEAERIERIQEITQNLIVAAAIVSLAEETIESLDNKLSVDNDLDL